MLGKTVFKLTVLYSFLFFVIFWSFSLGLYLYLQQSFGQGYVATVNERMQRSVRNNWTYQTFSEFTVMHSDAIVNTSRQVALEHVKKGLFIVNGVLFILIPAVAWLLVGRSLSPMRTILERQKQFVSDASHELLTPLAIAANEIEVTLRQERTANYYVTTLKALKEDILRLSHLIKSLLMLTQHENSTQPLAMQTVEVIDVIGRAIELLTPTAKLKNIRFSIQFPEENVVVNGNNAMLEQLFRNLLDNAVKFSPADKEITVSVVKKKHQVDIAIRDSGPGIPQEYQQKIFDRFFRIDASRSETKGHGLGLAIAKTIAELHHGTITVHSQISKGSTFLVSLPLTS